MKPTQDELLTMLNSGLVAQQVPAVVAVEGLVSKLYEAVAEAVLASDDPFFVAEKSLALGPSLVPYLLPKFEETADPNKKDLIAVVLFALGWRDSRDWLLHVVGSGREYEHVVIARLANARDPDAPELIKARLASCSTENSALVCELLMAMKTLGEAVPPEVVERVKNSSLSWEVRCLVDPDAPPPWKEGSQQE